MTPRQPTVGMENGHGHAHFWERALSRGVFIKAAGATGAVIGADVLLPGLVSAASHTNPTPKPIPGGFSVNGSLFHVLGGPGSEPSSITDFNGNVGIAFIRGTGTGTDTGTGATTRLLFDSDMRFMTGNTGQWTASSITVPSDSSDWISIRIRLILLHPTRIRSMISIQESHHSQAVCSGRSH